MWFEARLKKDCGPLDLMPNPLEPGDVARFHYFWDEPWHPGGFVVRLEAGDETVSLLKRIIEMLEGHYAVDNWVVWDPTPDEELYGDLFDSAMALFQASSQFAAEGVHRDKLIHCILNQYGGADGRWALRYARNRLRVWWWVKTGQLERKLAERSAG